MGLEDWVVKDLQCNRVPDLGHGDLREMKGILSL